MTVIDAFLEQSERSPQSTCFVAVARTGTESVNYGDLRRWSAAVAASLRDTDVVPGDRVVLGELHLLEFVAAFLGCLLAGAIPVPAPRSRRLAASESIRVFAAQSGAEVVLAASRAAGAVPVGCRFVEMPLRTAASDETVAAPRSEQIAYLQYTSGTTRAPRGVAVTHENVGAICEQARVAYGDTAGDVAVTWVPLYHDMGLVTGVLRPLWSRYPSVLLSPLEFLDAPVRWLRAISDFGGTMSSAPNFGYAYARDRVSSDDLSSLDLSRWRVARIAGEPVVAETLCSFAKRFQATGFAPEAFCPSFGLAEATLTVTTVSPGSSVRFAGMSSDGRAVERAETSAGRREVVSCGRPVHGCEVIIVDPRILREQPTGVVGEIWVRGPQVAAGYFGDTTASADVFGAQLADGSVRQYLRTGDLGAFLDDELVVVGRIKDVIVVRGANHYAHDVEETCATVRGVRAGHVAAFEVGDGEEKGIGIALELRPSTNCDLRSVAGEVVKAVARQHDVRPAYVAVLAKDCVPRTSSGKVRRAATVLALACRDVVPVAESGELTVSGAAKSRDEDTDDSRLP